MQPGSDDGTQDFIMISYPIFFINDPSDYLQVIKAVNPSSSLEKVTGYVRLPAALGFRGLKIAKATTSLQIANPLQAHYWSMVPYQLGLGQQAIPVKYSARACTALQDPIPVDPQPHYLRAAMRSTLDPHAGQDACMEFLVQPRTKASQDVEDRQRNGWRPTRHSTRWRPSRFQSRYLIRPTRINAARIPGSTPGTPFPTIHRSAPSTGCDMPSTPRSAHCEVDQSISSTNASDPTRDGSQN